MVYENKHQRRLKEQGIRIVTSYYDGGSTKHRSSDGADCDDVHSGVILDKTYLRHGKTVRQETEFNPGLVYSFVYPKTEDGLLQCPCCGAVAQSGAFSDGCPYCGSAANLEYDERKEGERSHADAVLTRRPRTLLWLLGCIAAGIAVCLSLTLACSRTRLPFDYVKGIAIGLFVGLGGFLARQIVTNAAVQRKELEKQQRQSAILRAFIDNLHAAGLSLTAFHNSLSAELNRYFYDSDDPAVQNVTDYDLLDIRDQRVSTDRGARTVTASVQLRVVSQNDNDLVSETDWRQVRLRQEAGSVQLQGGLNMIECPHCGAKVSVEEKTCRYCGSPVRLLRPLTLVELTRVKEA